MTHLEDVLAGILKALIAAQDQANIYTREISKKYWTDKILRSFPVPNALLTQVDLEFRFAVAGLGGERPASVPFAVEPSRAALVAPSRAIARWAIGILRDALQSDPMPPDPEKARTIVGTLSSARVEDSVAQDIADALYEGRGRLINADGRLDRHALRDIVMAGLSRGLLTNPDLVSQCRIAPQEIILDRFRSDNVDSRPPIGPLEALQASAAVDRGASGLQVLVEANDLSTVPEKALHKLIVKCELRNYKWVIHESGDELLVPED
jgi:hypothetical protein